MVDFVVKEDMGFVRVTRQQRVEGQWKTAVADLLKSVASVPRSAKWTPNARRTLALGCGSLVVKSDIA